ncbi:endonuclease domain-containing protein [Microterricola viridarii]|uniref:endonuclease domain-containing protein n=1 Tax=Microterricola viridarii TaxID=412690 RepID=UPI0013656C28|nr:DUF559 domain-containing protein [Microterricola viridarii]
MNDTDWHGLSRKRLRARDVDAPFRGVRSVGIDTATLHGRCLAYEPLLGANQLFCGVTAARLLGMPLPLGVLDATDLHVGTLDGAQPPRRRGVIGRRLPTATREATSPGGFSVTAPADTWCQLAATLTREQLTAVADYLISGERLAGTTRGAALCAPDELRAALERHGRRTGAAQLRWALRAARRGVDSAPETLLRLLLVAEHFTEPSIGFPVPVEGGLILHPDLAWPELRIAIEYEGDLHRSSARRYRSDIRRYEMLAAAGWRVIRVTADDLAAERDAFIARVHRILADRLVELGR